MPSCINLPFRRLSKSRRQVGYVLLTRAPVASFGLQAEESPVIVLLPGLGSPSPVLEFRPLAEKLGKTYKVIESLHQDIDPYYPAQADTSD